MLDNQIDVVNNSELVLNLMSELATQPCKLCEIQEVYKNWPSILT